MFNHSYHILLFYELFQDRIWKKYCSNKKCDIKMAKFQSFEDIKKHHENKNEVSLFNKKKTSWVNEEKIAGPIEIPSKYLDSITKADNSVVYVKTVKEGIVQIRINNFS